MTLSLAAAEAPPTAAEAKAFVEEAEADAGLALGLEVAEDDAAVIQRQVGGIENSAAVLAGVMVAQQYVLARQAFAFEGDVFVSHQAND